MFFSFTSCDCAAEWKHIAEEMKEKNCFCKFLCFCCFCKSCFCIMFDCCISCMECNHAKKKCIDVFWTELNKTQVDICQKLETAFDDLEKT